MKAGAVESDFFARWAGYYTRASNAQQTLHVTNHLLGALPTCVNALATMLVLVLGGLRVIEGHLSLGMLVAFQSLMQSFLAPVTTLVGFASTCRTCKAPCTAWMTCCTTRHCQPVSRRHARQRSPRRAYMGVCRCATSPLAIAG